MMRVGQLVTWPKVRVSLGLTSALVCSFVVSCISSRIGTVWNARYSSDDRPCARLCGLEFKLRPTRTRNYKDACRCPSPTPGSRRHQLIRVSVARHLCQSTPKQKLHTLTGLQDLVFIGDVSPPGARHPLRTCVRGAVGQLSGSRKATVGTIFRMLITVVQPQILRRITTPGKHPPLSFIRLCCTLIQPHQAPVQYSDDCVRRRSRPSQPCVAGVGFLARRSLLSKLLNPAPLQRAARARPMMMICRYYRGGS